MDPKILWLIVFVGLYWSYCLYMGFKGMASAKTASDYFISGRKLSLWVFVLAGTATSFSGWTFVGHPGLLGGGRGESTTLGVVDYLGRDMSAGPEHH